MIFYSLPLFHILRVSWFCVDDHFVHIEIIVERESHNNFIGTSVWRSSDCVDSFQIQSVQQESISTERSGLRVNVMTTSA